MAATALVTALVLGGGVAVFSVLNDGDPAPGAAKQGPAATVAVEQGTLSSTKRVTGTLGFAQARTLTAGKDGVLTAVPEPGTTITNGGSLYSLNNSPVTLLHGEMPLWRAFEAGMSPGPDVLQLETSLAALGWFGYAPDENFEWATTAAIMAWQKESGQEETGKIDFGSIFFSPGDVRVGAVLADVGAWIGAGTEMLSVTGLEKRVDIVLKPTEQSLAAIDAAVSIDLPDGTTIGGTVTSVGVPTEQETDGKKTTGVPVTVALDDPAAAGSLQQVSVGVSFPSASKENVLSVPIEALLALTADTYAVEVAADDGSTRRVPVTTGLFANGRVEISGGEISAGLNVAVPNI